MGSPQRQGTETTPRLGRHRNRSVSPKARSLTETLPGGNSDVEKVTVTVDQTHDGCLGFSVRGGAEHGLNIFISKVESNSPAEQAGLCVGDMLLEVNGISLENISMSSAVKVLTGHRRLRLVLQRVGWVPGLRYSSEKTTWVDLIHRRMVVEEGGISVSDSRSDGALCRTVQLRTSLCQPCLGLNIRGGTEYGLGIYVSKLDPGGLAEQCGIKMGDQILSANGVSFEDVTHGRAVEVLRSQSHIILTIKEAGRYPAYQEMVAEYRWVDKRSSRTYHSSSRGSDSFSSASSMSSGTPQSSLAGLSQATLPLSLPLGSQTPDACSFVEAQLDAGDGAYHPKPLAALLSRGPTELLQDSAIRTEGGEESRRAGVEEVREERKTSLLMALSRPSPPIRRSQSHMTASEDEQRKQKKKQNEGREEGRGPLQRSKTLFGLRWRRDSSRGRSKSPSSPKPSQACDPGADGRSNLEVLHQIEEMALKLLEDEDVSIVMEICQRYTVEQDLKLLVLPLLAILDGPEKLLLLREIRMLVSKDDIQQFNNMVAQFEEEAYDILKRRSRRSSPLRSPCSGHTPRRQLITPIPDQHGGFDLQPTEDVDRQSQLQNQLQQLQITQNAKVSETSRAFSPLLDIPVDSYSHSDSIRPCRASPILPNWLLTENTNLQSLPASADNGSVNTDESLAHLQSTNSKRGRLPFSNRHSESKTSRNKKEKDVFFTVVDAPRPKRPLLSQVFGSLKKMQSPISPPTGQKTIIEPMQPAAPTGRNSDQVEMEYELKTVSISKTKQSLGISISGGVESRVQPVVKIEQIFPGGAASSNNTLKAGFELVSVDGISLVGITHQDAVETIRRAFSNKLTNPMELVVKVPKHS